MRSILVWVFLLLLVPSLAAADKAAGRAAYEQGARYYDLGQFNDALDAFKRAYLNSEDPALLYNIGQCHRQLGNDADALKAYRSYLRKSQAAPNQAEVEKTIATLEAAIAKKRAAAAPASGESASPPPRSRSDDAAPPSPAPSSEAPPLSNQSSVYRASTYDSTLTSKRLALCMMDSGDWKYCDARSKPISENVFIARYTTLTGSRQLDGYAESPANKLGLITVGSLSGALLIATIASWATAYPTDTTTVMGYRFVDHTTNGAAFHSAIAFTFAFALTSVVGWPLALRQPTSHHRLSREQAQHSVDEFNRALGESTSGGGR